MTPAAERPDPLPALDRRPLSTAPGLAPPAVLAPVIVEAKLHPPRLHAEYLPRPRLLAVLDVPRPRTLGLIV